MKKVSTRERILQSAYGLFSEKGYLGTTTKEISQRACVNELTLFRHFGSKERLFEEVLERYSFLPKLREAIPEIREDPLDRGLQRIGLLFYSTLKEKRSMVRIMLMEISTYPEKLRRIYEGFIGNLIKTLSRFLYDKMKEGYLRNIDPEVAARFFLGSIFSYFLSEEILFQRTIPEDEYKTKITGFVDIFLRGTTGRM